MTEWGLSIFRERDGTFTVEQVTPDGDVVFYQRGFHHMEAALAFVKMLMAKGL